MRAVLLATAVLCAASPSTLAEAHNLVCQLEGSSDPIILTIHNRLPGMWAQYITPEVRVETGRPGETSPVEVLSYTADKIEVSISITLEGFPGERSALVLTIDRNTGIAGVLFAGPWRQTATGTRWREEVSREVGNCTRSQPRF